MMETALALCLSLLADTAVPVQPTCTDRGHGVVVGVLEHPTVCGTMGCPTVVIQHGQKVFMALAQGIEIGDGGEIAVCRRTGCAPLIR
jgi:hypothetical protein